MNKSIMMGRLVRDPEIRYAQGKDGELAIANFRIAVDRKYKRDEKTDFFKCTAFGRLAEFAENYLVQGIKIIVTGEMHNDNYTNNDGDKVYGVCLMADEIEFAESKSVSQREGEPQDNQESGNRGGSTQRRQNAKNQQGTAGKNPVRSDSRGRSDSGGSRNETRGSRERNHRGDLDEEFRDMEEHDEDYNFN